MIQGLTVSAASGLYGILMHVIATGVLVIVSGVIYRYKKTRGMAVVSLLCGMAAMAVVMMGANMVITPIFMGVACRRGMVSDAVYCRVQCDQSRN